MLQSRSTTEIYLKKNIFLAETGQEFQSIWLTFPDALTANHDSLKQFMTSSLWILSLSFFVHSEISTNLWSRRQEEIDDWRGSWWEGVLQLKKRWKLIFNFQWCWFRQGVQTLKTIISHVTMNLGGQIRLNR